MEFLGSGRSAANPVPGGEGVLYRALLAGDLPAAWLLARPMLERDQMEKLPWATAFNCGLCLYRLGEEEKALAALKRAEQGLGNPGDVDLQERKLFLQALSTVGSGEALSPLDPESGKGLERYALIRVRWLMALCLQGLERWQEAAPIVRFLEQYHINL